MPFKIAKHRRRCFAWLLIFFSLLVARPAAQAAAAFAGTVNLNTATQQELEQLPGVGPSKANLILAHRQRRPFRTVAELVRVKGFGAKTLQRLRPYLTVTGPTQPGGPAVAVGPACVCPDPSTVAAPEKTTKPAKEKPDKSEQ